jgi:hypothetical protein
LGLDEVQRWEPFVSQSNFQGVCFFWAFESDPSQLTGRKPLIDNCYLVGIHQARALTGDRTADAQLRHCNARSESTATQVSAFTEVRAQSTAQPLCPKSFTYIYGLAVAEPDIDSRVGRDFGTWDR